MNRFLQISLALAALTVAGASVWVAHSMSANLDKWGDGGAQTFAGLNQALATINRGCAPGPCGVLANTMKVETKIGDAVVQTQLVERATTPHVTAAMDEFADAAQHLSRTSDALTQTAQGASAALSTTNDTIRGLICHDQMDVVRYIKATSNLEVTPFRQQSEVTYSFPNKPVRAFIRNGMLYEA